MSFYQCLGNLCLVFTNGLAANESITVKVLIRLLFQRVYTIYVHVHFPEGLTGGLDPLYPGNDKWL